MGTVTGLSEPDKMGKQDGTLSYRMSCAHGVCGSDGMKINGRCALACQKLVKDYQDKEVLLEPLPHFQGSKRSDCRSGSIL